MIGIWEAHGRCFLLLRGEAVNNVRASEGDEDTLFLGGMLGFTVKEERVVWGAHIQSGLGWPNMHNYAKDMY